MTAARARLQPKHAPQRTCVGCGSTAVKRELIRLVRTSTGAIELDPSGKRPARGAYLCHTPECWDRAVKKGRLESALRTKLSPDDREALLRCGAARLAAEVS
jgi:predicted RNA-binding protein YlxR (DUF448 family)